jgi:hypothetical protein
MKAKEVTAVFEWTNEAVLLEQIERLKELKPEVKGYQFWNLRDLEDEHDLITKND